MEKPDIEETKPDVQANKPDIGRSITPTTMAKITKIREAFPGEAIFGRVDVMKVTGLKPSQASELLKAMALRGVIEPVTGHGKGKYRFRGR